MSIKNKVKLGDLSEDTLLIVQRVLKVTLSSLELYGNNHSSGTIIPAIKYTELGLHIKDVLSTLREIGIKVEIVDPRESLALKALLYGPMISEDDKTSDEHIRIYADDINILKRVKEDVDDIINNRDKNKIEFNELTNVLKYGAISHKFHNEKDGIALKLLKELWNNKGEVLPHKTLAVRMDLIEGAQKYNSQNEETINNAIKSLRRIFRNKKIPAKIKVENGVSLEA